MGWHNRITLEQFQRIKTDINRYLVDKDKPITAAALDKHIAGMHGVGFTTARHIRLSKDYEAYCKRTKGKYWYASEQLDKEPKLPHMHLEKRDVEAGASGCKQAQGIGEDADDKPDTALLYRMVIHQDIRADEIERKMRQYIATDLVLIIAWVLIMVIEAIGMAGK